MASKTASAPNIDRPRLTPEREAALAPIDQASAECYAHMEDTAKRFKALAIKIEESGDDGRIIDEILGDTSVVRHIEDLKAMTRPG